MKKIGITGTIGAGKTTLCNLLRDEGHEVFDSDRYCHALLDDAEVMEQIEEMFHTDLRNEHGQIERSRLAAVVFSKEEERKKLNALLHPMVKAGMREFFKEHETAKVSFAEVPLLFEAGMEEEFDLILVVTCSLDTALKRLCSGRGFTIKEAKARYERQIAPALQIAKADVVFHNDGTVEQLKQQMDEWLKEVES